MTERTRERGHETLQDDEYLTYCKAIRENKYAVAAKLLAPYLGKDEESVLSILQTNNGAPSKGAGRRSFDNAVQRMKEKSSNRLRYIAK